MSREHLRSLGVRAQQQEGEVIRAEGGQQQGRWPLEEGLLTGQIVNVLHGNKLYIFDLFIIAPHQKTA